MLSHLHIFNPPHLITRVDAKSITLSESMTTETSIDPKRQISQLSVTDGISGLCINENRFIVWNAVWVRENESGQARLRHQHQRFGFEDHGWRQLWKREGMAESIDICVGYLAYLIFPTHENRVTWNPNLATFRLSFNFIHVSSFGLDVPKCKMFQI